MIAPIAGMRPWKVSDESSQANHVRFCGDGGKPCIRGMRDLARVGDEMTFLRFLCAAAARSGQLLNLSELARDADIAPNTAKHWLSILQASGILYLLEPYHTNLTKRLVKAAKLYFLDTGLCAYLTGWSNAQTLETGAMSGAMLETWAVAELLKSY